MNLIKVWVIVMGITNPAVMPATYTTIHSCKAAVNQMKHNNYIIGEFDKLRCKPLYVESK